MPTLTLAQRAARSLDATEIVALTLWGEARGQPVQGIIGVGNVISNRVRDAQRRWGTTWQDVCLRRWQFSCWIREGGEANYERMVDLVSETAAHHPLKDKVMRQCWWIARGIVDDLLLDVTKGANHYYADVIPPPKWAKGQEPTVVIGLHRFFKL
jgi:hypothetical protein